MTSRSLTVSSAPAKYLTVQRLLVAARGPLFVGFFFLGAFFLALGPRMDSPFPTHVDEWTHLAYAEALVQDGHVPHRDPLYDLGPIGFRPELGFRVLLAQVHLATGLPWESFFPALAGAVFALFAVICLFLGRRLGVGPLLGILALGTPTTVRFLGPALVVPVALGLVLLVTLALTLVEFRLHHAWPSPLVAAPILGALLLVHPPTAFLASLLLVSAVVINPIRSMRNAAQVPWSILAVAIGLPIAWLLVLSGSVRSELIQELGAGVSAGEGLISEYVLSAGIMRIAVFAVGIFAILLWAPRRPYLALVGAAALLLVYVRLHEAGILPAANFYDRAFLYIDLILATVGALGLGIALQRMGTRSDRLAGVLERARPALFVLLGLGIVFGAWHARSHEEQYRIASASTLEDFRWIRQNLDGVQGLTLVDPMIAVAYPAIAGRPVYASAARPRPSTRERAERAEELLVAPEPDLPRLEKEGIGVVYRPAWGPAEGVREVRPGIFVISDKE